MKHDFSFVFLIISVAPIQINNGNGKETQLKLWFINQASRIIFHLKQKDSIELGNLTCQGFPSSFSFEFKLK
jgi:hypothetical protein